MANVNTIETAANNNGTFEADLSGIGKTGHNAEIIVANAKAADAVIRIAEIYNIKSSKDAVLIGDEAKIRVALYNVDDEILDQIQRKIRISEWGDYIIGVAGRVRDGVTNMGDFALNGALVPAAGAAISATARTAQVTGRAAARLGAIAISSVIEESSTAFRELSRDPEIWRCAGNIKNAGSSLKDGVCTLFNMIGAKKGNSKFTRF